MGLLLALQLYQKRPASVPYITSLALAIVLLIMPTSYLIAKFLPTYRLKLTYEDELFIGGDDYRNSSDFAFIRYRQFTRMVLIEPETGILHNLQPTASHFSSGFGSTQYTGVAPRGFDAAFQARLRFVGDAIRSLGEEDFGQIAVTLTINRGSDGDDQVFVKNRYLSSSIPLLITAVQIIPIVGFCYRVFEQRRLRRAQLAVSCGTPTLYLTLSLMIQPLTENILFSLLIGILIKLPSVMKIAYASMMYAVHFTIMCVIFNDLFGDHCVQAFLVYILFNIAPIAEVFTPNCSRFTDLFLPLFSNTYSFIINLNYFVLENHFTDNLTQLHHCIPNIPILNIMLIIYNVFLFTLMVILENHVSVAVSELSKTRCLIEDLIVYSMMPRKIEIHSCCGYLKTNISSSLEWSLSLHRASLQDSYQDLNVLLTYEQLSIIFFESQYMMVYLTTTLRNMDAISQHSLGLIQISGPTYERHPIFVCDGESCFSFASLLFNFQILVLASGHSKYFKLLCLCVRLRFSSTSIESIAGKVNLIPDLITPLDHLPPSKVRKAILAIALGLQAPITIFQEPAEGLYGQDMLEIENLLVAESKNRPLVVFTKTLSCAHSLGENVTLVTGSTTETQVMHYRPSKQAGMLLLSIVKPEIAFARNAFLNRLSTFGADPSIIHNGPYEMKLSVHWEMKNLKALTVFIDLLQEELQFVSYSLSNVTLRQYSIGLDNIRFGKDVFAEGEKMFSTSCDLSISRRVFAPRSQFHKLAVAKNKVISDSIITGHVQVHFLVLHIGLIFFHWLLTNMSPYQPPDSRLINIRGLRLMSVNGENYKRQLVTSLKPWVSKYLQKSECGRFYDGVCLTMQLRETRLFVNVSGSIGHSRNMMGLIYLLIQEAARQVVPKKSLRRFVPAVRPSLMVAHTDEMQKSFDIPLKRANLIEAILVSIFFALMINLLVHADPHYIDPDSRYMGVTRRDYYIAAISVCMVSQIVRNSILLYVNPIDIYSKYNANSYVLLLPPCSAISVLMLWARILRNSETLRDIVPIMLSIMRIVKPVAHIIIMNHIGTAISTAVNSIFLLIPSNLLWSELVFGVYRNYNFQHYCDVVDRARQYCYVAPWKMRECCYAQCSRTDWSCPNFHHGFTYRQGLSPIIGSAIISIAINLIASIVLEIIHKRRYTFNFDPAQLRIMAASRKYVSKDTSVLKEEAVIAKYTLEKVATSKGIIIKNLYKSDDRSFTLINICLRVECGSSLAVTGVSKERLSALLGVASGRDNADLGDIYINGVNVVPEGQQIDLGYATNSSLTKSNITVQKYFELISTLRGQWSNVVADNIKHLSVIFKASSLLKRALNDLDCNEARVVKVMAAFLNTPDCVILDHPTRGVSNQCGMLLCNAIKTFVSKGVTVMLATSSLGVCEKCGIKRLCVLSDGEIIWIGNLRQALKESISYEIVFGLDRSNAAEMKALSRFVHEVIPEATLIEVHQNLLVYGLNNSKMDYVLFSSFRRDVLFLFPTCVQHVRFCEMDGKGKLDNFISRLIAINSRS